MFCRQCGGHVDDTDRFCPACGIPRVEGPPLATGYAPAPAQVQDDPAFAHFLRMVGVSMAMAMASWVVIGLFWQAHMLSKTGYRKRDLLLLLVPIYGSYVAVVTMWRYTARDAYWTPRDDRPSEVLHGRNRPWAIALGWLLFPIFMIGIIVLAVLNAGWSDADREELVDNFVRLGVTRPVAECMADEIIADYPAGPNSYADDDEISRSFEDAVDACSLR